MSVSLTIMQVAATELQESGVLFSPSNGSAVPSLFLPSEIFSSSENMVGMAFAAYTTASLFPVGEMDQRFSIASTVVGIILHNMDTSSLAGNVTVTLPFTNVCSVSSVCR